MPNFVYPIINIRKSNCVKIVLILIVMLTGFSKSFSQDEEREKLRLFLITVIDSDDEIIGKRCQEDLSAVTDAFNEFSGWLGTTTVFPKVIDGGNYSKASVNDALDNWLPSHNITKEDIIVFYFSGHGYRLDGDESEYPRMWLKTANDRDIETNNLRMKQDIYDRIVKMGAGINIILSDCCNTVPGTNILFAIQMAAKPDKAPKADEIADDIKDFDKLFNPDNPVSVIATAADSTELAGGTASIGGFFTYYLLEALDACIYEDDLEPTWENVLTYARNHAAKDALAGACPENKRNQKGRCIQTAKYTVVETGDNN